MHALELRLHRQQRASHQVTTSAPLLTFTLDCVSFTFGTPLLIPISVPERFSALEPHFRSIAFENTVTVVSPFLIATEPDSTVTRDLSPVDTVTELAPSRTVR